MPYQNLSDGLYLVSQESEKSGILIKHFGVLDVGNVLQHSEADGTHPLVIHQTPPRVQVDWLGTTGSWTVMGRVTNTSGAMERLKAAFSNPEYDLFGNNCEHFARFVTQGSRRSDQVLWAGVVAVGALAIYAFKGAK